MKTIPFEIKTGAENMQIDSDLLEFAIKNQTKEPVFRLYGWSPACVSLGRNQKDDFINKELLKLNNIDVVRRLTGGRALLHDRELTYSCICPIESLKSGQSVTQSYKEISKILICGFELLGIKLEFPENKRPHTKSSDKSLDYCMSISTGADLSYEGKKLIGSAQFRKEGYILQHGSILFDYDKNLLEEIFKEKTDENDLICLNRINSEISYDDVISSLLSAWNAFSF